MDTRPNKRQRRLTILSSDDDEHDDEGPHLPQPSGKNKPSTSAKVQQILPTRPRLESDIEPKTIPRSSNASPRRPSRKSTKITSPKVKPPKEGGKPISAFFGIGARQGQQNGRTQRPAEPVEPAPPDSLDVEQDDVIEDDSPSEKVNGLGVRQKTTMRVLDRRKDMGDAATARGKLPSASQRFKVPTGNENKTASTKQSSTATGVDGRPWAERYGPQSLEELAVHKKKVIDVRTWLENVLSGKDRRRLLILKGPAGAGKTTTLRLLAKTIKVELSEWRNPVGSDLSSEGYSSMSVKFTDFLGRSGRFGELHFTARGTETISSPPRADSEQGRRKIILLEEFPNTSLSASTALRSFRSNVMEYLATSTPSMGARNSKTAMLESKFTPMVMIITETRLTTMNTASDSFTAHRLLGSEILSHPGVSLIEFNPIASTFLTKALEVVLQKEARHSGRRRIPGPSVLKRLGEVGDVRSAIGSLEFLCVRGQDGDNWSGRVAAKGKKSAHPSDPLTKMEQQSLELVTQRESSLGLFHAVGKVVYNKRDNARCIESGEHCNIQPPEHLSHQGRLRVSQVAIDQLIDETGTDTATFIAALHENYVMSCEGNRFLDSVCGCMDALSDSDILVPSHHSSRYGIKNGHGGHAFQGSTADSLRHEEMLFHLSVRGLLFALPYPVKRAAHPVGVPGRRGGKGDAYKMFYPTSMRLSRQMEEIDELVERWVSRLRVGTMPSHGSDGGYRKSLMAESRRPSQLKESLTQPHDIESCTEPHRTSLNVTRSELIVERLPYISKITQRRAAPPSERDRELERITQFHGIDIAGEEESGGDEDLDAGTMALASWSADRPGGEGAFSTEHLGGGEPSERTSSTAAPVEEEVQKLYLTDDDIEDD